MKLLLDTHTFIWWDSEPARLSSRALALCQDFENKLLLSVASTWEMQIKAQLGKLKLGLPLPELIENQQRINSLQILHIGLEHVWHWINCLPSTKTPSIDCWLLRQG